MNTKEVILIILFTCFSFAAAFSEPVQVSIDPTFQGTIDLSRSGIKNPHKLLVDKPFLYIVDHSEAVYKCDLEGDVLNKITHAGLNKLYPAAIAKDFQYLFVLDRLKGIVKFTLDYDFHQYYWISPNMRNAELAEPQAIAIDKNKDIYIADGGQNSIIKTNALGLLEWQFGRFGSGPRTWQDPVAIAIGSTGLIYIVDQAAAKIQVYTPDQSLLYTMSEFNEPTDIALLPKTPDTLFICDKGNSVIEIFQNGKQLRSLNTPGKPQAISINNNYLYVLDAQTKRIYVYAL